MYGAIIGENEIDAILPQEFRNIIEPIDTLRAEREGSYERTGFCRAIPC